ncbi:DMT family transporter [Paraferrimonas haliotis]|uniref:EamA domain-containing protein n=1 Tax=Paraferrimonas haliotis TaxID=2013866 RepID=A0AA37TUY5_9GAMM|nr:DMT family transporter [Paraferrimonas haliotis]GLS83319.1 hypothetical protein GCM10007894_12960 [Paraferrimonas haliotis]
MKALLQNNSLFQLHTAVLLFGGTALFSKLIPLPALDITFWRCLLAAAVLAVWLKVNGQAIALKHAKDYLWGTVLGVVICLHWVTYFASMQLSTVAIGVISFFSYPVMVTLAEPYLNKQKIALVDVVASIVVFFGVALMMPSFDLSNQVTQGVILGVISAALFTARNLLYKRHFSQYSGQHSMLVQSVVACVILLPFLGNEHWQMSGADWSTLALLAVVFTALPHALFNAALGQLPAKSVSFINCLQPLYATSLALLILGEVPSSSTLLGGFLVVTTAMYETLKTHKNRTK